MSDDTPDPVDVLVDHLINCTPASAAVVVDGSADSIVASMLAEGWTWDGTYEHVAGKRIRMLVPPPGVTIRPQP